MGEFGITQEFEMPLHLQLSMRKAEIAAQDMTCDQLQTALLNLYHQRLLELQAIKDLMQEEAIEMEFDIPTDLELAQLALSFMGQEDTDDEDDMPLFG
jgi:hypothetical protein|tara:strand:- start:160 stop:453 length:294 start_codon:yes stop_codon:yes gene_type:complete